MGDKITLPTFNTGENNTDTQSSNTGTDLPQDDNTKVQTAAAESSGNTAMPDTQPAGTAGSGKAAWPAATILFSVVSFVLYLIAMISGRLYYGTGFSMSFLGWMYIFTYFAGMILFIIPTKKAAPLTAVPLILFFILSLYETAQYITYQTPVAIVFQIGLLLTLAFSALFYLLTTIVKSRSGAMTALLIVAALLYALIYTIQMLYFFKMSFNPGMYASQMLGLVVIRCLYWLSTMSHIGMYLSAGLSVSKEQ